MENSCTDQEETVAPSPIEKDLARFYVFDLRGNPYIDYEDEDTPRRKNSRFLDDDHEAYMAYEGRACEMSDDLRRRLLDEYYSKLKTLDLDKYVNMHKILECAWSKVIQYITRPDGSVKTKRLGELGQADLKYVTQAPIEFWLGANCSGFKRICSNVIASEKSNVNSGFVPAIPYNTVVVNIATSEIKKSAVKIFCFVKSRDDDHFRVMMKEIHKVIRPIDKVNVVLPVEEIFEHREYLQDLVRADAKVKIHVDLFGRPFSLIKYTEPVPIPFNELSVDLIKAGYIVGFLQRLVDSRLDIPSILCHIHDKFGLPRPPTFKKVFSTRLSGFTIDLPSIVCIFKGLYLGHADACELSNQTSLDYRIALTDSIDAKQVLERMKPEVIKHYDSVWYLPANSKENVNKESAFILRWLRTYLVGTRIRQWDFFKTDVCPVRYYLTA